MIRPFADDDTSTTIAGMSVENGTTTIVVTGNLSISRDREGLEAARRLKEFADALLEAFQTGTLPERIESDGGDSGTVANPFK
nr:hypothetical protein [Sphingobium sp.]